MIFYKRALCQREAFVKIKRTNTAQRTAKKTGIEQMRPLKKDIEQVHRLFNITQ